MLCPYRKDTQGILKTNILTTLVRNERIEISDDELHMSHKRMYHISISYKCKA